MNAKDQKQTGTFEAILRWALGSMFGHMAFFTVATAVPLAIWLLAELYEASALTPLNALAMLGLSIATGLATAYGLWRLYFRTRRLPPS
jgi:hypothetical protein